MSDEREDAAFGTLRLVGGRYSSFGLPVGAVAELQRYEKLLERVANRLYLQENPRRRRVPRGFGDLMDLRLVAIGEGSVVPVLSRTRPVTDGLFPSVDWYDESRRLINEALREISDSNRVPSRFPRSALGDLAQFGRSLRDDERIELSGVNEPVAVLDPGTRTRIAALAQIDEIEIETTVLGQITGLRSDPQRFDLVLIGQDRYKLQGAYSDPAMWGVLRDLNGFAYTAPLSSLTVVAKQNRDGDLIAIVDVISIEAALPPRWAARIAELAQLQDGWLPPSTEAPTRGVLDVTEELLLACVDDNLPRPSIYPSGDGGVQLEWRAPGYNIEVELLNDGRVELAWFAEMSDETEEVEYAVFDAEDILQFIKRRMNA